MLPSDGVVLKATQQCLELWHDGKLLAHMFDGDKKF